MTENLTLGYKKNYQKKAKTVFKKKLNQEVEKSWSYQLNCLRGYFDLSSKTYGDFFFFEKKIQKTTSVNFVGPDP